MAYLYWLATWKLERGNNGGGRGTLTTIGDSGNIWCRWGVVWERIRCKQNWRTYCSSWWYIIGRLIASRSLTQINKFEWNPFWTDVLSEGIYQKCTQLRERETIIEHLGITILYWVLRSGIKFTEFLRWSIRALSKSENKTSAPNKLSGRTGALKNPPNSLVNN